jgi:hypothetical protein
VGGYIDVLPVQAATCTAMMQFKFRTSTAGAIGAAAMTLGSAGTLNVGTLYGSWMAMGAIKLQNQTICSLYMSDVTGNGIASVANWLSTGTSPMAITSTARTDGANNIVIASVYVKGSAITNAATMRLHQFSVVLDAVPTNTELASIRCNGDFYCGQGANGDSLQIGSVTELTTIAAAAYTDTTIQIPAGAKVLSVVGRVTVQPGGTATMDVGVAGATTRFATGVSTVAGTTFLGDADTALTAYAAAVSVRLTPNGVPSDAAGRVRVKVYYFKPTAPTS